MTGIPTLAQSFTDLFAAKSDWEWSGSDQAASLRLPDGRTIWLFGDTILGTRDPSTGGYAAGWRMISNSMLMQVPGDGTLRRATVAEIAVPNPSDGDRYWPMTAWEHAGRVYALCQRVRPISSGLGFRLVGAEIAAFTVGARLGFVRMWATPGTGVVGDIVPQWCGATAVTRDGFLYIYGYKSVDWTVTGNPQATYLARTPVDIALLNEWQFWGQQGWSFSQSAAIGVVSGQVSSAAYVNNSWVLLHKPWNGWGSDVIALKGARPQGPFNSQVILSSPEGTTPSGHHYQTYCPELHPEWKLDGTESGKTLVSIAYNGKDLFADTAADANLYKPRFYAIGM